MTLEELSKMTMDALQVCIAEGVDPDDVFVFSGDFHNIKQIPRVEMRVREDKRGDKRFAICFVTIND